LHKLCNQRDAQPPREHFDQGVDKLDFVPDDATGILGIAKCERRAPFGIATPAEDSAGKSFPQTLVASRIGRGLILAGRIIATGEQASEKQG